MPEVFLLYHPILCSSCVFLCAKQETKSSLVCEYTVAADDAVLYTLVDGGWQFVL